MIFERATENILIISQTTKASQKSQKFVKLSSNVSFLLSANRVHLRRNRISK